METACSFFPQKSYIAEPWVWLSPLVSIWGSSCPCRHPLLPTRFPKSLLPIFTTVAGLHPSAFCLSFDHGSLISLLHPPSLFKATCARLAMDKKRVLARRAEGLSSWMINGGRDHSVQTQLRRGIGDSACRAAWSCGRV